MEEGGGEVGISDRNSIGKSKSFLLDLACQIALPSSFSKTRDNGQVSVSFYFPDYPCQSTPTSMKSDVATYSLPVSFSFSL